jgi:hypothetical protein
MSFLAFVLEAKPNHIPLTYMYPIKTNQQIKGCIYLIHNLYVQLGCLRI